MNMLKLAALAKENLDLKKKVEELTSMVEKRAEVESLLTSGDIPLTLKPSGVEDFITKRNQIEKHDLGTVKLAMQMANTSDFGVGEPEADAPLFPSSGSQADDMFTAWLLGSES